MAVGVSPGELRELTDDELTRPAARVQGRAVQSALPDGDRSARQQPSAARTVRQEIARVYTVLRERELGLASGPAGEES